MKRKKKISPKPPKYKKFIPNNYQYHLRRLSFQQDANEYVKRKYNWSARTSVDTDWESHLKILNKPSNHSYQVKVQFVHHLLSSGKTNYSIKHAFPFYKTKGNSETHNNHFLTCNASEINKVRRIAKLKACLTLLDTPNIIIAIIIRCIKSFYYNIIQPPLDQLSPTFLNIQKHQEEVG